MTVDPSAAREPALLETPTPLPERPVLITGLGSFAMMNGAGEFSFVRETRGAPLDWGGTYAQSVRLTGPWTTRVDDGSGGRDVGRATLSSLRHSRGGLEAEHRVGRLIVRDEVSPTVDDYGLCRTLVLDNPGASTVASRVEVTFEPFLAPVLMEGVKPRSYTAQREGASWLVRSFGFALSWETDPEPQAVFLGGESWSGDSRHGPTGAISFRWSVPVPAGQGVSLHLRVVGGLLSTARADRKRPVRSEHRCQEWDARIAEWTARTPSLAFPDAPLLEAGYVRARGALRSLYTAPDASIAGLVAGYPWYPALWCRDLAWMLPAVQWLGDAAWVEQSLRSVFRFQARTNLPVLGARSGELPMQIAPGPVFLYGTSDTTLYYPGLVRRFSDHTGSLELARSLYPNLVRAVEWGRAKTRDPSGLIANGGEVAAMKQETEIGRVRVGFDAVDTTIWDSTDRRDHAIDVQLLWLDSLEAIGSLSREIGVAPPSGIEGRAEALRKEFASRYGWPQEGYLYDSLRADGSPVRTLRPNALRAVRYGLLPDPDARALVHRAATEDLSTPWGVRTLSNRDPSYDPLAYHDGRVWTIATAWAAEAALWAGERALGVEYLLTNARRLVEEGGYAAECYRGDRPEPFDACFLLGFSVAPFLSNLFGSLWGIEPHLTVGSVDVRPRFPDAWHSASLSGLTLGRGSLSLSWSPGRLEATWSGPDPLSLTGALGRWRLEPGTRSEVPLPLGSEG
ncbi:MAG: hypothetical protein L3J95_04465 [Thermoplasmata archaeon]|nr:hypothetical protein [Thermoplasmata archaeon]MCI4359659.1 hypothetical protein [Thermoplasmata archaeon]